MLFRSVRSHPPALPPGCPRVNAPSAADENDARHGLFQPETPDSCSEDADTSIPAARDCPRTCGQHSLWSATFPRHHVLASTFRQAHVRSSHLPPALFTVSSRRDARKRTSRRQQTEKRGSGGERREGRLREGGWRAGRLREGGKGGWRTGRAAAAACRRKGEGAPRGPFCAVRGVRSLRSGLPQPGRTRTCCRHRTCRCR